MRRSQAPPKTGWAAAAWWAALFAFDAVLIALVVLRFHLSPLLPGLMALGAALGVALVALGLAIGAFVVIWRKGVRGFGQALASLSLSLAMLGPGVLVVAMALSVPAIVDVSTDTADPPELEFAASDRPAGANATVYDPANAARQASALPQIQSMLVDVPAVDMRRLALRLIHERRWLLVSDIALAEAAARVRLPGVVSPDRIEAVSTSRLFGTMSDIAIRVRSEAGRTRVDMRSAARYGSYDFGANADNVRDFMADLRALALLPNQSSQ